jgi:hypothetical protein
MHLSDFTLFTEGADLLSHQVLDKVDLAGPEVAGAGFGDMMFGQDGTIVVSVGDEDLQAAVRSAVERLNAVLPQLRVTGVKSGRHGPTHIR